VLYYSHSGNTRVLAERIHEQVGGALVELQTVNPYPPEYDTMAEILEKMVAADAIVIATPVYFYMMAAQMKTLIDRTCSRYQEISNKDFYFIMTAAETDKDLLQRTLEAFRGFTACLNDPVEMRVIYDTGTWNIGEIKSTRAMGEAYEMGNNA